MKHTDILELLKAAGWDQVEEMPIAFWIRAVRLVEMVEDATLTKHQEHWYDAGYKDGLDYARKTS